MDEADPKKLSLDFLDAYREVIAGKLSGLDDTELRTSRLPSGWTPMELVKHLIFMERRWLLWGFAAEQVEEPWGDNGPDGRWRVSADDNMDDLVAALRAGGQLTREIVSRAELADVAASGGRFTEGQEENPTLTWILFHVLQEYARHAGHLDIARELADGSLGE